MTSTALKMAIAIAGSALVLGAKAQGDTTRMDFRPIQISFVPYLGTNGFLSNRIENGCSFNLLGGISKGVRWGELGGVANITKGSVTGAQAAGIINLVEGDVRGGQLSGIVNTSKKVSGVQSAGIANLANGDVTGAQLSGIANISHNMGGVQAAGIHNNSRSVRGAQLAGIANITGNVNGIQIAGILNKAKDVKGVQLGLVNISDTCSGIPIGLVNIVRKGYRQFEAGTDDMLLFNLNYRSGVKKLHTTVGASILPRNSSSVIWGTTFGIGTSYNLSARMLLDADLMYTQVVRNDKFNIDNKLFRAYLGIDRHLYGKLSVAIGITANALIYSTTDADNIHEMKQLVPYTIISEKLNSRNHLAGWLGGRVSFRIN